MAISRTQKEDLLDRLLRSRERGGRLYSRLLRLRKAEDAAAAQIKNKELTRLIEQLWDDIAQQWRGDGQTNIDELRNMNAGIERSITGLKDTAKRNEAIAKGLDLLDDVIGLAVGLIG
jgi:hypothetical protein